MKLVIAMLFALAGAPAAPAVSAAAIPPAVIADPPPDPAHPARMTIFALPVAAGSIPAMFYNAQGAGPHPSVILFSGMPGAELNSDLVYAIRRAGWNVVVFHHTGSWGSPGVFSFGHCLEDARAAVAWLRHPSAALAPYIDPDRIVVAGHSMGGWVAGYTAAHDPKLMGAALISSANFDRRIPQVPRAEVAASVAGNVQSPDGLHMLGDITADGLADEMIRNAKDWDLTLQGEGLAKHPLLIVTSDDGHQPEDDAIEAAARARPGAKTTNLHFATNHGYNDHRIALAGALVQWLSTLPGAPRG